MPEPLKMSPVKKNISRTTIVKRPKSLPGPSIAPRKAEKAIFVCTLEDLFVILRRFRVRWGKTREADRHPPRGEIRYLTKHQCTQS